MVELPRDVTALPLHLTVDPISDVLVAIAFGRVDDGLPHAGEWLARLEGSAS